MVMIEKLKLRPLYKSLFLTLYPWRYLATNKSKSLSTELGLTVNPGYNTYNDILV